MHISKQFGACGVALVSPFTEKGRIDFNALSMLCSSLIEKGIDYLVALGTTAETPTLSKQEKGDILRCIIDANQGRVPIMAGAGGNDTRAAVEAIKALPVNGLHGVLSVAPYYNKPGQEGLYQHFSSLAAVSDLPLVLYNVPGRCAVNMSANTVLRLAYDHDGIIAIKEASGDMQQVSDIIREMPAGFKVFSGDDADALPMIALGASGLISVIGNAYPGQLSAMVHDALQGKWDAARNMHHRLSPMMRAIFREGNPAGIKAALALQGKIENVLRLPLTPVTLQLEEEIAGLMTDLC